jgi:peroxiredoxin
VLLTGGWTGYNRNDMLQRAPSLSLPDDTSATIDLDSLWRDSPLMLVFYRGHWCPYCRRYLCKLQLNLEKFLARGIAVAAISPEPPSLSAGLRAELGLKFRLLSDTDGTAIGAFGTRNSFTSAKTLTPHPAVFLIATSGEIVFRTIDRNYKKRSTMRSLLQAVDTCLPSAAT